MNFQFTKLKKYNVNNIIFLLSSLHAQDYESLIIKNKIPRLNETENVMKIF